MSSQIRIKPRDIIPSVRRFSIATINKHITKLFDCVLFFYTVTPTALLSPYFVRYFRIHLYMNGYISCRKKLLDRIDGALQGPMKYCFSIFIKHYHRAPIISELERSNSLLGKGALKQRRTEKFLFLRNEIISQYIIPYRGNLDERHLRKKFNQFLLI